MLARCAKGPWYDLAWPKYGLHATRNPETHRLRRRVWDKAFTKEALTDYVPRMLTHSDELIQVFQKMSPGKVDVTEWFGYYVFDGLFSPPSEGGCGLGRLTMCGVRVGFSDGRSLFWKVLRHVADGREG